MSSPTVGGKEQEFLDFLMGSSEYTVLIELKTPHTPLFASTQNRAGTWSLSKELIDAESQILEQKASLQAFADKNPEKMVNRQGNRISHRTLNPKTILIVGCKDQSFVRRAGVSKWKSVQIKEAIDNALRSLRD